MKSIGSVFDVVGRVMVGPSSSHTAGALRIGRVARQVLGEEPVEANIILHGSFAETYKGHGTDKAIVAGLLGFAVDDERVKHSFKYAELQGLKFNVLKQDLGPRYHPNTVKLVLKGVLGGAVEVVGSSIGGGNVVVVEVNGFEASITGSYHTLITVHSDVPGVAAKITSILASAGINIATMRITRKARGGDAFAEVEVDHPIPRSVASRISSLKEVKFVRVLEPV